jgi:uncharacterized protein YceK
MKTIYVGLLVVLVVSTSGCSEVLPRERGNLALPQMAFTTDGLEFGLRQHTAFSKEAAAGGYGGSGGGCGCN